MPCLTALLPRRRLRLMMAALAGLATLLTLPLALADGLKQGRQGDYTLVSGGVNEAEVDELEKLAARYQIQLVFKRHGTKEGVTGVKVRVRNTPGDLVVETTSVGPYVYVNPPSGGRYTVEVELDGETLTKTRDLVGRRYLHLEFDFGSGAGK